MTPWLLTALALTFALGAYLTLALLQPERLQ